MTSLTETPNGVHPQTGEGTTIRVRSFTDPHKTYVVDLEARYCGCKRFHFTGSVEGDKHFIFAEAIRAARGIRFGKYAAEESVTRLCRAIFCETDHRNTYRLLTEVMASPYATEAMVRAAKAKHAKAIGRAEVA